MNEFKVGDTVKLITDNIQCKHGFNKGDICKILYIGRSNSYPITISNGRMTGYANEDELELVKKLTKKELLDMPTGTKITTDAEDKDFRTWIKTEEKLFNNRFTCSQINEYSINENLTLNCAEAYGTKIIKVEEPTYTEIYSYEAKEMTVAEIEKELGYSIKVVKEEN